MSITITTQMVDGLLGGYWPPDTMPSSRKLLLWGVWEQLEAQFGADELMKASLLAGTIRDERLHEFWRRDLYDSTPAGVRRWQAEARRELAAAG